MQLEFKYILPNLTSHKLHSTILSQTSLSLPRIYNILRTFSLFLLIAHFQSLVYTAGKLILLNL